MSTAIEFVNISKQYRLGLVSTGTLNHDLNGFWQTKVLRRLIALTIDAIRGAGKNVLGVGNI